MLKLQLSWAESPFFKSIGSEKPNSIKYSSPGVEKLLYPGIQETSKIQIWQTFLAGPKALQASIYESKQPTTGWASD